MTSKLEKLTLWSSIAGVAKTTHHLSRFRTVLELPQGINDRSYLEAKTVVFSWLMTILDSLGLSLGEKGIGYVVCVRMIDCYMHRESDHFDR